MNVLILSAGQRVSLLKAFQKELNLYNSGKVYAVDANPWLSPACHIADGFKKVPFANDGGYVKAILSICKEWNIGMIVPTIDSELLTLAENKSLFDDLGVHLIISSLDFVIIC